MEDDRLPETEERQEDVEFDEDETEEEEEDDDDYEDEDDDEEDYEEEEVDALIPVETETTSPRVSSSTLQAPVVINGGLLQESNECVGKPVKQENGGGDDGKKELNTSEIDVCPICFEAWTSDGDHRICCLPCGHIYGMSCIVKWLFRSGKCPQCKSLYSFKDVIVLYTKRLSVANEELNKGSHPRFPLTEEGFTAFQQYVFSYMDASQRRIDALERQMNSLEQTFNEHIGRSQENTR